MKKFFFFLVFLASLLVVCDQAFAQERRPSRENRPPFDREAFFAKRNAYITDKVGLSAEKAAIFFPVENELMRKKFEIGRECHRIERNIQESKEKTEDLYKELLKCRETVKEKTYNIEKEYFEKFKKILTAEEICKYQNAERFFFDDFMKSRNP